MDLKEMAIEYNKQMKESLSLIFNELNNGQRKKLLNNPKVKALLKKYGIIESEV